MNQKKIFRAAVFTTVRNYPRIFVAGMSKSTKKNPVRIVDVTTEVRNWHPQ
jgi:hypothetical protein